MEYTELHNLGPDKFQNLFRSLLLKVIGNGVTTFDKGPDGGREAKYSGPAPYPSKSLQWVGNWIFQAKFHTNASVASSRNQVVRELDKELDKITNRYSRIKNYILGTNVPLSAVNSSRRKGTHERIEEVKSKYANRIPNIEVWDFSKICSYLDLFTDIRNNYFPKYSVEKVFQDEKVRASLYEHNNYLTSIFDIWKNTPVTYGYHGKNEYTFDNLETDFIDGLSYADDFGQLKSHLKTGYPRIYRLYRILERQNRAHNNEVRKFKKLNNTVRNNIQKAFPNVSIRGNDILLLNTYYISNILDFFKIRWYGTNTKIKVERYTPNNIHGWRLLIQGQEIFFGERKLALLFKSFLLNESRPIRM